MLNVHLYFAKLFGCLIVDHAIPIDAVPFAKAIVTGKPHSNVYLEFGRGPFFGESRMTGITTMATAMLIGAHQLSFASWLYCVDPIAVRV